MVHWSKTPLQRAGQLFIGPGKMQHALCIVTYYIGFEGRLDAYLSVGAEHACCYRVRFTEELH